MQLSDKYPFLTDYFIKALSAGTRALPQSILFYGNDLDTQYKLANEIARFLNCKDDRADDCECLNCKWIREGMHPAVLTISKTDNKPADDESTITISVKQSQMIKDMLVTASEFHRVFIFCGRDDDGNIAGLNPLNFQQTAANSMLKIIEEPLGDVTFIFLARYIDDVLPTIVSRSQCFFVPSLKTVEYDYSIIDGVFTEYYDFERKDVFDISGRLQDLATENSAESVLTGIQNYMLQLLKSNPRSTEIIKHIELTERAKSMIAQNMKPANVFDDLCLKVIH